MNDIERKNFWDIELPDYIKKLNEQIKLINEHIVEEELDLNDFDHNLFRNEKN